MADKSDSETIVKQSKTDDDTKPQQKRSKTDDNTKPQQKRSKTDDDTKPQRKRSKTNNNTKPQPKRSSSCCVIGCKNSYYNTKNKKVKFYSFPKLAHFQERREIWISLVNNAESNDSSWRPSNKSKICSDHFLGSEKSDHPMSPSYNPSLFPGDRKRPRDSAALISRFNRLLKRQISKRKKLNENSTNCEPRFEQVFIKGDPLNDLDLMVDQSVQVYYPETKESNYSKDTLFCSIYKNDNVCEAQTQTCIVSKQQRTLNTKKYCEKTESTKNVGSKLKCSTSGDAVNYVERAFRNDHNYFKTQN